jgi:DNA-binding response OmpR family regulator
MHKLMLIEDDDTMRSLLKTLLEFEGFTVAQLDGGGSMQEILEKLRLEKPALILLDVHLRNVSGFDLVKGLRQDEQLKSTQVLMASGMELSVECRQAGADGFILKPFMPEELVGKIRNALETTN